MEIWKLENTFNYMMMKNYRITCRLQLQECLERNL